MGMTIENGARKFLASQLLQWVKLLFLPKALLMGAYVNSGRLLLLTSLLVFLQKVYERKRSRRT